MFRNITDKKAIKNGMRETPNIVTEHIIFDKTKHLTRMIPITADKKSIDEINKAFEIAKIEHKLLELYRKLSKELHLEIVIGCDSWDGIYAFETLECQVDNLPLETFKQIQKLEKELEEKRK
jgi:hypothetical protein